MKEIEQLRGYNKKVFFTENTKNRIVFLPFGGHITRYYGEMTSEFHVKPIHYVGTDKKWHDLSEISSYFGNKKGLILRDGWENRVDFGYLVWYLRRQKLIGGRGIWLPSTVGRTRLPLLLNTVTTVFPDPDPETTSVDGYVGREPGACETWGTLRAGAGNQSSDVGATIINTIQTSGCSSPNWINIYAGITLFDTSSIPDSDSISSATYSIYGDSTGGNTFSQSVVMTDSSPASNTALVNSDYANRGGTEQATARISVSSWSTTGYNDWTLNATGLGNISRTGVSKFGTRMSADFDNAEPSWANGVSDARGKSADTAGTSQDPKLAVTHSSGVSAIPTLLLLGIG